jgi:hypothetical protein
VLFDTKTSREKWVARAGVLALGVSAVAAFFTFMQWKAADRAVGVADRARIDANTQAERQRQDAQEALRQQREDAAAATKQSSDAVERTLKQNREATNRQFNNFENSQAGVLMVEDFAHPDFLHTGWVTFNLVNRGSTVVRIKEQSRRYSSDLNKENWDQIRKDFESPLSPALDGEAIAPGRAKPYKLGVDNPDKLYYTQAGYVFWYKWSYVDAFNRPHMLRVCYYYEALHEIGFSPCWARWNRQTVSK